MIDRMHDSEFFCGAYVAFDSFTSFTEQQYAVIGELLRVADVSVTIPLVRDAEHQLCYEEAKASYARLRSIAERAHVSVREQMLDGNRRTLSEPIRFLGENLWRTDTDGILYTGARDASVRHVNALTPYAAARFIAEDISRRVREEGALYRDFAVITANMEAYRGILDTALLSSGIPVFSSDRMDISSLEPMKLIASAYAVCIGGFRRSDLLSYLKCGFSGIPSEDVDAFELYTERWRLDGRRITDRKPWTMNPDGYTDRLTPHGERVLQAVNRVREQVALTLLPFRERAVRQTVAEHCRVLCDFLLSIELPARLSDRARLFAERQDGERAEQLSRLWQIICDTLDTLAELLPDSVVSAEEFAALLKMVGEEVDIGRIPASEDEVTFGSAEMLRAQGVRHVYLLGAMEGEFPASGAGNSFFTEQERTALGAVGLCIGSDCDIRSSRELFVFLRALTAASVSATVLTSTLGADLTPRRPSSAVERMHGMLGDALPTLTVEEMDSVDLLWSRGGALDRLGELVHDPIYPALARALSDDTEQKLRLDAVSVPISNENESLSEQFARQIYPGRMATTQSRIERYVKCPFLHFCTYVLKLHSQELADFDNNEIGSYVHAMLEEFFREGADRAPSSYSAEEIDSISARLSLAYLERIGQGQQSSPRMRRLWRSLHRSSRLLISRICRELSESDFTPRFYELKIGGHEPDDPSACTFETADGGELSIYGSVDRVDTCLIDGRAYVRVIDYKTGTKTFQLEDVRRGMNLQMLLYLFALWKNRNPAFAERLGIGADGKIIPAGVLYMGAGTGEIRLERPLPAEETERIAREGKRQNGLLLDDRTVLEAMEHGLGGKYIPVKCNRDGTISGDSQKNLISLEGMGKLLAEIGTILSDITADMKSGKIPAYTTRYGKENCTYCEMRPVCRASFGRSAEEAKEQKNNE